ncbi:MAG: hypothetical protein KGL36_00810 [Gammaproteobacteria bacterium]|nr:hypothetical protein [Gammaproteobacteria bacterium]
MLADTSMTQLGISVHDYHPLDGRVSPLQDPQRVIAEMPASPMAEPCVGSLERALAAGR